MTNELDACYLLVIIIIKTGVLFKFWIYIVSTYVSTHYSSCIHNQLFYKFVFKLQFKRLYTVLIMNMYI